MAYTPKDLRDLHLMAAQEWFGKYREFLSMYTTKGEDGLRARMQAFFAQENWGTEELAALAENSMGEAEMQRAIRMNPDADFPDYDRAYINLFQKLTSQAFLHLQERGALEDICQLEEIPAGAEAEYTKLIAEANGGLKKSAAQSSEVSLDDWVKFYNSTPTEWMRKPAGGVVRMKFGSEVREIPVAEFRMQFDRAVAQGKV